MAAPELIRIRVRNLLPALALLLIACGGEEQSEQIGRAHV